MNTRLPGLSSLSFLLLVACDGGGSSTTADTRVDPIDEFRLQDWVLNNTDGAQPPRADNGRLRLESTDPTGPNPTASITSRVTGQYSDFGANLQLARPNTPAEPADYQAFLSLDVIGTTTGATAPSGNTANQVGTKARIGLRAIGSTVDLVAQVLDTNGNPIAQRVRTIGSLDGEDGKSQVPSADVRLQLDQDEEIIRFFSNGQLEFTYVPTTLELPANSSIGVVAEGRKFLVFVDDFLAVDVNSATPSFTYESSALAPTSASPGTVRFLFTLRDQSDQVLNVPAEQLVGANLFFTENGEPIDRVESNPIFKQANLAQDVVIVLDYSASLSNQPDGIATMVTGAKALADGVWGLNPENRVQFWEFHDSFTPAAVLVPQPPGGGQGNWLSTAQREIAFAILDTFAPYNGFSRVFDAVADSTASFGQDPREALRSVVFLTDGFDTGSDTDADDLIAIANEGGVALYPLAIGSAQPQLRELRRIAANTRGNVYPVPEVADLVVAFGELGGDLGSLYSASYVSSRDDGPVEVTLDIDLLLPGAAARQRLPVAASATVFVDSGDTRIGWLDFRQTAFTGTTATVRARATFVPRTVDTFSIGNFSFPGLGGAAPAVTVGLPTFGLLDGWTMTTSGGVTTANGPTLGFGDFGDFVELTITGIPATANQFTLRSVIQNGGLAPVGFLTVQPGVFLPPSDWQFDVTLVRPPSTP